MRRDPLLVLLLLVAVLVAAQPVLHRTWILDGATDRPIAGAYVAVMDAEGVVRSGHTNTRGLVPLRVRLADRAGGTMLVCAPAHAPMVTEASSGWFSRIGLAAAGEFSISVLELGWEGPVPAECGEQVPFAEQVRQARREQTGSGQKGCEPASSAAGASATVERALPAT